MSKPGYLCRRWNSSLKNDIVIGALSSPIMMWAGDIAINEKQDDTINMADIMKIAKSFDTISSYTLYNPVWDFDKDGAINMHDIMIVARHFIRAV